jgi:Domain of unknown function (DUF4411)
MALYSFDSSAFINPFRRYYPQDLFPKFWDAVAERIVSGEIIASEVVRDEIDGKDDQLKTWVRAQSGLFIQVDEEQQDEVATIMRNFPTWVDIESSKNNADPFVIALAKAKGLVVVSDEGNGSEQNPKIPFVCREAGVRHLKVVEFIRAIGLRFT